MRRTVTAGPSRRHSVMDLKAYQTDGFHDELFDDDLEPRPGAEHVVRRLAEVSNYAFTVAIDTQNFASQALWILRRVTKGRIAGANPKCRLFIDRHATTRVSSCLTFDVGNYLSEVTYLTIINRKLKPGDAH